MKFNVTATINGQTYSAELTDEAIITGLVRKGWQETLSDAQAGKEDKEAAIRERMEALLDGSYVFGQGGGGARLNPVDAAMRQLVETWLRSRGHKAAPARKLAMDPEAALRGEVGDDADTLLPKFRAKAERMAELASVADLG